MKKFTHVFCFILMCLFTFSLVGCNTKNSDDRNAENAIKKYLNTYYTIDKADIEVYKKITSGSKPEEIKEYVDIIENSAKEFKSLMTDTAYQDLFASRMSYGRIKQAYENKYYVTVKNINLEKYAEDKKQQMLVYYYDIELMQTSVLGNEVKNVKDRKQIKVFKTKNSWKVG